MTDESEIQFLRQHLEEAHREIAWIRTQIHPRRTGASGNANDIVNALFPVDLETDGGADGDVANAPTYTYTVSLLDGTPILTGVTPTCRRPNGSFEDAIHGMAYKSAGGTYVLYWADEIPNTGECAT